MLVYANSVSGVFVLDDFPMIVNNPQLSPDPDRTLLEAVRNLFLGLPDAPHAGRPVVSVTLWLNHWVAQKNPFGYHLFNIAVHVLSGLALFGLLRRTLLRTQSLRPASLEISFAAALIWCVHPLTSSAVTYISQRAESLMALFFLLSIYAVARGAAARVHEKRWLALAVVCCGLAESSKEVGAMVPILALLYDRAFLSGSWQGAMRTRRTLHLAMFATWAITIALLLTDPRRGSYGWGDTSRGLTAWNYATAQCAGILGYIRLVFWPDPLVLDYGWPVPTEFSQFALPGVALVTIVAVCSWAVFARARWGFLGAWFFICLGPSSSFIPLPTEILSEHRMYLPSMAVIAAAVVAAYLSGSRLADRMSLGTFVRRSVGVGLLVTLVGAYGLTTVSRNALFHSGSGVWEDNVRHTPDNPRALSNLGDEYAKLGRSEDALAMYREAARKSSAHGVPFFPFFEKSTRDALRLAIRLDDRDAIHEQLTLMDGALGRLDQSIFLYTQLGNAYERLGREREAVHVYERAIEHVLDPTQRLRFHRLLGGLLFDQQQFDESLAVYRAGLRLEPELPESAKAIYTLRTEIATILLHQGRVPEATQTVADALGEPVSSPGVAAEIERLAALPIDPRQRRLVALREQLSRTLISGAGTARIHSRLGQVLMQLGDAVAAEQQFETAKRLNPTADGPYNVWGTFLYQLGRRGEAKAHFRKAIALRPENSNAHRNLGIAQLEDREYAAAVASLARAVALDPGQQAALGKLAEARRLLAREAADVAN
jgi:tetratricopeptide (TPR) repeat protein